MFLKHKARQWFYPSCMMSEGGGGHTAVWGSQKVQNCSWGRLQQTKVAPGHLSRARCHVALWCDSANHFPIEQDASSAICLVACHPNLLWVASRKHGCLSPLLAFFGLPLPFALSGKVLWQSGFRIAHNCQHLPDVMWNCNLVHIVLFLLFFFFS